MTARIEKGVAHAGLLTYCGLTLPILPQSERYRNVRFPLRRVVLHDDVQVVVLLMFIHVDKSLFYPFK